MISKLGLCFCLALFAFVASAPSGEYFDHSLSLISLIQNLIFDMQARTKLVHFFWIVPKYC